MVKTPTTLGRISAPKHSAKVEGRAQKQSPAALVFLSTEGGGVGVQRHTNTTAARLYFLYFFGGVSFVCLFLQIMCLLLWFYGSISVNKI